MERGKGAAGFCLRTLSIVPGPMGLCPPIFGWGLGPEWEPRAQAQENPGSELEVRTRGQHGGGGLHLTGPPPSPSPMAPQGTQPHITRASPHLPATSPHSQPRHLACPPLPRTLRRAGEGAAGQVPTPEPGRSGRSPSPQRPFGLEVGQGAREGGGRCSPASRGSFKHPELIEQAPSGQCQPAPSPSSSPHSTANASNTGPQRISKFLPFPSSQRWG